MNELDHIVLAVPDLDAAKNTFELQTGVRPIDGGPHEGLGTRNALVSLGDGAYLEIIAPDPTQPLARTRGERFAALSTACLLHWAIRTDDLHQVAAQATEAGLAPSSIIPMARTKPDGERLEWELLGIGGHELGGCVPFFIDWKASPHPADSAPVGGALKLFQVDIPTDASAHKFLKSTPPGVSLAQGDPHLTFEITCDRGVTRWTANHPEGFGL